MVLLLSSNRHKYATKISCNCCQTTRSKKFVHLSTFGSINTWQWTFNIFIIVISTMIPGNRSLLMDSAAVSDSGEPGIGGGLYLDKIDLEKSIAAVFNKVAYGSTTTKRSIPDNVFVPSLTTVPTPPLTTFRYREREKESSEKQSHNHQQMNLYHRNYDLDLERDHALPTSAPNADILKSNNNPTYPNPNRHHNHDRHRHLNSTPAPSVHNLLKKGQQPTVPMYPIDMPSYSPPSRSFFTPPHPPGYQYPFADKPTLRGTNSDTSMINAGSFANRRPIPPPSLMPGHERIPYRPPDLVGTKNAASLQPSLNQSPMGANTGQQLMPLNPDQRKKALNTPAQKNHKIDLNHNAMDNGRPESALTGGLLNSSEPLSNNGVLHFPSISRILSGSNGRKEDIPEVLLRTVTVRPSFIASASEQPAVAAEHGPLSSAQDQDSLNLNKNRHLDDDDDDDDALSVEDEDDNVDDIVDDDDDDDFSIFDSQNIGPDEPKTQPKIKQQNPKSTQSPFHQSDLVYSTQIIQNLANINEKTQRRQTTTVTPPVQQQNGNTKPQQNQHLSTAATWTVAWNIHVYLSAILFTVLAVYSIFKMIFYDKLTHLFNQSYFICIHLTLIVICLARIFFLCYDAYNIHLSFPVFISELLLNLPATFLTISFAILILFLLIRSLNHKNNRYSALMRPLTVVVGSSVHVGLCITLHYVESNASQNQIYYQAKAYNGYRGNVHNSPPRVLSLICQIIYIFVCISLGFFYLYVYRILKRVLRNKSQNYIHGYQNLSYAIHITIATALLFILMAALQVYGAISISTTRPLVSSATDVDWLQCGYQFSLRLIEIAIITLLSWVTGLKTGTSKVLQREKGMETHNVSGFALFPCTSSSSQEHFETDYPAICNANTNLHTYTLRTGKPIYDDNFALNSLGMDTSQQAVAAAAAAAASRTMAGDFQTAPNDFRNYETNSIRSSQHDSERIITDGEFLNDSGAMPDHYENPNFELRPNTNVSLQQQQQQHHPPPPSHHDLVLDNCYSEPLAGGGHQQHSHHPSAIDPFDNRIVTNGGPAASANSGPFDFQNFEKPSFDRPANCGTEFRASKNLKAMKQNSTNSTAAIVNHLDRGQYDNPERRSSNSNHSYASSTGRNFNNLNFSQQNSFERRGLRKSGTLNNIGGIHGRGHVTSSSSNSSSGRASGVQTLSSSRSQQDPGHHMQQQQQQQKNVGGGGGGNGRMTTSKHQQKKERHRSSIERRSTSHLASGYMMSEDEYGASGGGRQPDTASNASSDGAGSLGGVGGMDNRDGIRGCHFKSHSGISSARHYDGAATAACIDAQHSSSGESATSGSMLVAEHGFVRFRALDDMGIIKHSSHLNSSHHGQQQPSGAGIQTNPTSSFRTTGRNKERAYTNS